MHCLHFRWRNINNKTIMSRFWPNSKPNIFVTGKFLMYIFIVNESRIALGPVNGAYFPALSHHLRQKHGSRVLILSPTSTHLARIIFLYWYSRKHVVWILTRTKKCHKKFRVPCSGQLSQCHELCHNFELFISGFKRGIFQKQQPSSKFLYCLIATLWLYDRL